MKMKQRLGRKCAALSGSSVAGFVLLCQVAGAQPAPPDQPDSGPGGSEYSYVHVKTSGPYFVTPGPRLPAQEYYVFQPADTPRPESLPVILFLHAYLIGIEGIIVGDSPRNYTDWINHMVKKGYTVVYAVYDWPSTSSTITNQILRTWQDAVARLSTTEGLIPPKYDEQGMETMIVGHSLGAYQSLAVAQWLSQTRPSYLPLPRGVVAIEPGVSDTGLSLDFSELNQQIRVVLVKGDADSIDIPTADAIWASLTTNTPAANRDYLEVQSDYHGVPQQVGDHFFPLTTGVLDTAGVDDRDFNVGWKLSVGMANCVFGGDDCSFALGHGQTDQINMGFWSDGVAVKPMLWIP